MKANQIIKGTMNKLYLRYLLQMFSADYLVIQSKINQPSANKHNCIISEVIRKHAAWYIINNHCLLSNNFRQHEVSDWVLIE